METRKQVRSMRKRLKQERTLPGVRYLYFIAFPFSLHDIGPSTPLCSHCPLRLTVVCAKSKDEMYAFSLREAVLSNNTHAHVATTIIIDKGAGMSLESAR